MDNNNISTTLNTTEDHNIRSSVVPLIALIIIVLVAIYRDPCADPSTDSREMLLGLFKLGLFIIFFFFLWLEVNKSSAILLLLSYISAMYPQTTPSSIDALYYVIFGLGWYAGLFFIFKRNTDYLNYALCIAVIAHSIVIFVNSSHNSTITLMTNANEASAFLALCLPSFLLLKKPLCFLLIIPLIAVLCVKSFNGTLAISIVFLIYGIYLYPKFWGVWVSLAIVGILVFCTKIDAPGASQRLCWWGPAIDNRAKSNPFFGCGIGNWKHYAAVLVSQNKIPNGCYRLENTWLQLVVEMGVVGYCFITICIGIVISKLRKDINIVHLLGIVAFLVVSNTNSLFQMNAINCMASILLFVRLQLAIIGNKQ